LNGIPGFAGSIAGPFSRVPLAAGPMVPPVDEFRWIVIQVIGGFVKEGLFFIV